MSTETTNMLQFPVGVAFDPSGFFWYVLGGTDYRIEGNVLVTAIAGIPDNAEFVLLSDNPFLSSGRVLTGTTGVVVLTDNGAGSTVVISLNAAGVSQLISAPRTITAAGNVTVTAGDVAVNMAQTVAQAVNINVPPAADKIGPVFISDALGVAAADNFTILPDGAETIVGLSSFVLNANFQSVILRPIPGVGYIL